MKKGGLADSPFFTRPEAAGRNTSPPPKESPVKKDNPTEEKAVYQSGKESAGKATKRARDKLTSQPIDRSIDPSTNQSTDRPIDQSTGQSTEQGRQEISAVDELGPVVDRPRAFYITAKVDRWLDEAVRYLQEKGVHKADRSVLVNALLHDPDLYQPASLDKLRASLLAHLTNKSLKRVQSTE
jgi:hypothetical protein